MGGGCIRLEEATCFSNRSSKEIVCCPAKALYWDKFGGMFLMLSHTAIVAKGSACRRNNTVADTLLDILRDNGASCLAEQSSQSAAALLKAHLTKYVGDFRQGVEMLAPVIWSTLRSSLTRLASRRMHRH